LGFSLKVPKGFQKEEHREELQQGGTTWRAGNLNFYRKVGSQLRGLKLRLGRI